MFFSGAYRRAHCECRFRYEFVLVRANAFESPFLCRAHHVWNTLLLRLVVSFLLSIDRSSRERLVINYSIVNRINYARFKHQRVLYLNIAERTRSEGMRNDLENGTAMFSCTVVVSSVRKVGVGPWPWWPDGLRRRVRLSGCFLSGARSSSSGGSGLIVGGKPSSFSWWSAISYVVRATDVV